MKRLICLFLFLVIALTGCSKTVTENTLPSPNDTDLSSSSKETPQNKTTKANIAFFGDLLMHDTLYKAAKTGAEYDFTSQFSDISKILEKYDFKVGNLETTFAGNNKYEYSGYPQFNCPESLANTLKDTLKLNLVATANNHSADTYFYGISNTIDVLDSLGIAHIGSYKTIEDSLKPTMFTINEMKIGFLNYTYGVNVPLKDDKPFSVSVMEKNDIIEKSETLKNAGVEFIFLISHWGNEYELSADTSQTNLTKWLFENTDINAIVGHHPHVVQSIEEVNVMRNGKDKKGFVAYSLGNFIGDQGAMITTFPNDKAEKTDLFTNSGIIAGFELEKDFNTNNINIKKITYTPTYIDKNQGNNNAKFRVVAVNTSIENYQNKKDDLISEADYNKLLRLKKEYAVLIPKCSIVAQTAY